MNTTRRESLQIAAAATLFALLIASTFACIKKTNSKPETVDIPQTPVDNQMKVGFCWAYTTTAFLESIYKSKTGVELNLSEEYIGFFKIAEELLAMTKTVKSMDEFKRELRCSKLAGWSVRMPADNPRFDAMELVDNYGIVPENVYRVKFINKQMREKTFDAIKAKMFALAQTKDLKQITRDDIIRGTLVNPGTLFDIFPPQSFGFMNGNFSPVSFLRQRIKVQPLRTRRLSFNNEAGFVPLIESIKMALKRGDPVPLSFGVNRERLVAQGNLSFFTGAPMNLRQYAPEVAPECDDRAPVKEYAHSRHAVLVTDFVNDGGREGAMPPQEVQREFAKPAAALSYLKFKNSWGIQAEADESGIPIPGTHNGYYGIDKSYILNSLRTGVRIDIVIREE